MAINQDLYDLYRRKWNDFLKMQSILNGKGITDYSSPLLMYCWENEYESAKKKILFVGQETNSWFDPGSSLNKDSLNTVIKNYQDFEMANGYNSIFWRFIKKLNSLVNSSEYCYLWTNINKFGRAKGKGRPSPEVLNEENQHFNILKEELQIIRPDAVIFLSGPKYDQDIINKLGPTDFIPCTSYTSNRFAQVVNPNLPAKSFRIYHPNYLSFRKKTNDYLAKLATFIS